MAAALIAGFGTLSALLRAPRAVLKQHLASDTALADLLLAVRPLSQALLRAEMFDSPVLADNLAAIRYLHFSMAHEPAEQVRVLYLDSKNRLVSEEVVSLGTVSRADIFPREIIRRALDVGATGLILAHNHPSGDLQPSRSDMTATRAVADAARLFDIQVHDHLIVSRSGYRSLRDEGYL